MRLQEEIERLLAMARDSLAKAGQRTHQSRIDFDEGRIAAYKHCLDLLPKEKEADNAKQFKIEDAAMAVVAVFEEWRSQRKVSAS